MAPGVASATMSPAVATARASVSVHWSAGAVVIGQLAGEGPGAPPPT